MTLILLTDRAAECMILMLRREEIPDAHLQAFAAVNNFTAG